MINADGVVLGRLATRVASILRGKHRAYFSPQWDMGDYVIVYNAAKVKLTGNKEEKKIYYRHSGYPGGLKEVPAAKMRAQKPEYLITHAVKGMLPKNRLSRQVMKKLFVYAGEKYDHRGKKLKEMEI